MLCVDQALTIVQRAIMEVVSSSSLKNYLYRHKPEMFRH